MELTDLSTARQNLKWKHNLLVNFCAEDGVRQHSKSNDFDPIRKPRKYSRDDTWLLSPYFSSKRFENFSFGQSKSAGMTNQIRYKLVCKVMRKRLYEPHGVYCTKITQHIIRASGNDRVVSGLGWTHNLQHIRWDLPCFYYRSLYFSWLWHTLILFESNSMRC